MASKSDLPALVRKVVKVGVTLEALSQVTFSLWTSDPAGSLHILDGHCNTNNRLRNTRRLGAAKPSSLPTNEVTLPDLLDSPSPCETCMRSLVHQASYRNPGLHQLLSFVACHDTMMSTRRMVKAGGSRSAGRLPKLASELKQAEQTVETYLDRPDLLPGQEALLRTLREDLVREQSALSKLMGGDKQRDKAQLMIKNELIPRSLRTVSCLDESLTLAGFYNAKGLSAKVREVVEVYRVGGTDLHPVLHGPRYVMDWILRTNSTGNQWYNSHLFCSSVAVDAAVAELAAGIWDPTSDGPMADISAAAEAAGIL